MGQYHYAVNLDKKEYLHPHKMGDGLKLLEWSEQGMLGAIEILLAASDGKGSGDFHVGDKDSHPPKVGRIAGRWAGNRIALVGDYYEVGDIPKVKTKLTFDMIERKYKEISDLVIPTLERVGDFKLDRKDGWRQRYSVDDPQDWQKPKVRPDMVLVVKP